MNCGFATICYYKWFLNNTDNKKEDVMTRTELIATVAEKTGIAKAALEKALNGMISAVSEELTAGNDVRLPGLGILKISERAARTGRNPKTGSPIEIAASKAVTFRAAKELKDALNS